MSRVPVAIVGRGAVLPGAPDTAALWRAVRDGVDLVTAVPEGAWPLPPDRMPRGAAVGSPLPSCGAPYRGGFVTGDGTLEADGYRVAADIVREADRSTRWLLEAGRQAVREAGREDLAGTRAAAVVGNLSYPTRALVDLDHRLQVAPWFGGAAAPETPGRLANAFPSGRPAHLLADVLGIDGPAEALDAACASSLYAASLGCGLLARGEADVVLVAAVNGCDNVFLHKGFEAIGALSPTGRSRPFHRDADGLLPAEGAAALLLRRLEDAERDGDWVFGVILGIGLSNDGRRRGLLVPDRDGQVRAMRAAWADAGLDPAEAGLVECHATGTQTGDGTEVEALREVFAGARDLPAGSLKSNIGHAITVAGLAGILKVTGALAEGVRPPTLHADAPLEALGEGPVRLLHAAEPWPDGRRRSAGISTFGFGGNNAHMVLAEHRPTPLRAPGFRPPPAGAGGDAIVVCGVGVVLGGIRGLDGLARAVATGSPGDGEMRTREARVPLAGLRFPPRDLAATLAQQTLPLEAAQMALDGLHLPPRERCGVVVGMGCDPEAGRMGLFWRAVAAASGARPAEADVVAALDEAIGGLRGAAGTLGPMPNFPANRINVQHDLAGLGMTVSSEELSGLAALFHGARLLASGALDLVLAGAVDATAAPVRALALDRLAPDGPPPADGVALFALMRRSTAAALGNDVLCEIEVEPARRGAPVAGDPVPGPAARPHAASAAIDVALALAAARSGLAWEGGSARPAIRSGRTVVSRSFTGRSQTVRLARIRHALGVGAIGDAPHLFHAAAADRRRLAAALEAVAGGGAGAVTGDCRIAIAARTAADLAKRRRMAAAMLGEGGTPAGPGIAFGEGPARGGVAFAFPGLGAPRPGALGRILTAFPDAAARLAALHGEAAAAVLERAAAGREPATTGERSAETATVSLLLFAIARDILGVVPDAAFGLSLGEEVALVASGVWPNETLRANEGARGLFHAGLGEDHRFVRSALGRPADAPFDWENLDVFADLAILEEAVRAIPDAFVTIVTADGHAVVSGPSGTGAALRERLPGVPVSRQAVRLAAHGPFAAAFREPFERAITGLPVLVRPGLRLYHASTAAPAVLEPEALARHYTATVFERVDLRPLVRRVHADGVAVFVDIGPGAGLAAAVARCLDGEAVTVAALNRPRRDGLLQIAEAAATLFAAGVPVDVSGLAERLARLRGDRSAPEPEGAVLRLPVHLPPLRRPSVLHPPRDVVAPPAPISLPVPQEAIEALWRGLVSVGRTAEPPARRHAAALATADAAAPGMETLGTDLAATKPPPAHPGAAGEIRPRPMARKGPPAPLEWREPVGPAYGRRELETLAGGRISEVFGPRFARQDGYRRQCRMPQPPLLLVDRVLGIEGEPGGMGRGTCWTETDVVAGAWYLDGEAMPVGILIEAGQADLLLISWLGCDFLNRGERVYRLLGCEVTFHDAPLPVVGDTIRYQIHIDRHASIGDTRLFFFRYDSRVNGRLVSSVREGQAGFFSDGELAGSDGVLWSPQDHVPRDGARVDPPPRLSAKRAFGAGDVEAFAAGDAFGCFGEGFEMAAAHSATPRIPSGRMRLIDRIAAFDPAGGPLGRGYLRAEADVPVDAWFYDGHFLNDPCMPGTLMAEAGAQAVAFLMAAMGFTIERDGWRFRPVRGEPARFVCRGQVVPDRPHRLTYEVFVEEVRADAVPSVRVAILARCDGFKVFLCDRFGVELVPGWPLPDRRRTGRVPRIVSPVGDVPGDQEALLACALGRPGDSFGSLYAAIDAPGRRAPRLPAPPYHVMSRILWVDCPPGVPTPGGSMRSAYDVPADAWYFEDGGTGAMPFSVLTEVLLQPCGWLASYMGFALADEVRFRNLDAANVVVRRPVTREIGTLVVDVTFARSAAAGATTIVFYDVVCRAGEDVVAELTTDFGFFPPDALAVQRGLPATAARWAALLAEVSSGPLRPARDPLGTDAPALPSGRLALLDEIAAFDPCGGIAGLGRAVGRQGIDPRAWYFKAHFFEDPVQPGSLGLEALFSLLKAAIRLGGHDADLRDPVFESPAAGEPLLWRYRGQVTPRSREVLTEMDITAVEERPDGRLVRGSGSLWVDGLRIYEVADFAVRIAAGRTLPPPARRERTVVLDPVRERWLGDHRPTVVVPAFPIMGVAGIVLSACRARALDDLEMTAFLRLDEGAVALDVTKGERTTEGLPVAVVRDPPGGRPVARGRIPAVAERAFLEISPALDGAVAVDRPYETFSLVHSGAFRVARDVVACAGSSRHVVEVAEARAAASGGATVLLDALLHGFPHARPDLWLGEDGAGCLGVPYRIERMRLFEDLPEAGRLAVETRLAGRPTVRTARIAVTARLDGRPFATLGVIEALLPHPLAARLAPGAFREFCQHRVPHPDAGLCQPLEDGTVLALEDVERADIPAGTVAAVWGVPIAEAAGEALAEAVAIKEWIAGRQGLHPADVVLHGEEAVLPDGRRIDLCSITLCWDAVRRRLRLTATGGGRPGERHG